jgi:MraZ protein
VFLGVSTLNLDAKGRLAVPARHRETLAQCCASRVVVTVNPMAGEKCLWLFPEVDWRDVERTLSRLPAFDPQAQAMRRLMIGFASELELDGQGRILLSNEQRDFAGLDKRVALVGQGKKFEIWDEQVWSSSQEQWRAMLAAQEGGLSEALQGIVL